MKFGLKITSVAVSLCLLGGAWGRVQAQAVIEGHVKLEKSNTHVGVVEKRYNISGEPATVRPDPASAIVYLEGHFDLPKNPPKAQMVQKNLDFVNNLLAVQVGTTVEFP